MTTFTLQDLTPAQLITDHLNAPEVPRETKEVIQNIMQTQHAPTPQPSGENPHNIGDIVNAICTQLQLLATVISQSKAQPDTTPPEGANLQDCVEQVLTQAVWFEKMVKDEVESRVESEVEMYFERRFDPTDHFDFGDAVSNEVHDRLDDVVRDQLDDKLEEVVAEKLESASVSISF